MWEVVAPGGNGSRHADHLLRQQGKQEFPVKPSTAAAIVVLGQVSELEMAAFLEFGLPLAVVPER